MHAESALIHHVNPLRGALLNLFASGEMPTYVWRARRGDGAGFIQLQVKEENHRGHILYLSSTAVSPGSPSLTHPQINEDVWLPLLDQAIVQMGHRGIQSLVAEVSEIGPELPILRRAGFAVYTRQDIWVASDLPPDKEPVSYLELQPHQSLDDWDVHLLYANIVPRLVQLVEPLPPLETGKSWTLREGDELMAFVHLADGDVAGWLRLFVHPNAESRTEEIVQAVLRLKPPRPSHPLFCCVPRYQSWMQRVLPLCGFKFWGSQAVMVKHTVLHMRRPLPELAAVLESHGIPASSPIVQQYYRYGLHANEPKNGR